MFHAKHVDKGYQGNIVVRANDIDVFLVLITNVHQLLRSHLWHESGLDHDNSRAFHDITRLAAAIPYRRALPELHGFTGCDYSPSFFRKGKVRPLKLMLKHQKFVEAFSSLGKEPLNPYVFSVLEEFVCCLYGVNLSMSDGLMAQYENKCKPKVTGKPLSRVKCFEASGFMPCQPAMFKQVERAWFIACLYKEASNDMPCGNHTPNDFGWKLSPDKERFEIDWFSGL